MHAAPIEAGDLAAALRSERVVATGVGPARAALSLTRALLLGAPPELVIGFGVCGAYPARLSGPANGLAVGELCVVTRDVLADEGVVTETGFVDLPALGLAGEAAFTADLDRSEAVATALGVAKVAGATVGTCSGTDPRARELAARTGAAVETMEGAAIALVCARFGLPWIAVRAVSNWCGDRSRGAWDLARALAALHAALPRAVAALGSQRLSTGGVPGAP